MSPTGMMSLSLRLAMYVSAAEWFNSVNNSGVKPAISSPKDSPPHPANR